MTAVTGNDDTYWTDINTAVVYSHRQVSMRGKKRRVRWVFSRALPPKRITERDRMSAGEMRRAGEISETRQLRKG